MDNNKTLIYNEIEEKLRNNMNFKTLYENEILPKYIELSNLGKAPKYLLLSYDLYVGMCKYFQFEIIKDHCQPLLQNDNVDSVIVEWNGDADFDWKFSNVSNYVN